MNGSIFVIGMQRIVVSHQCNQCFELYHSENFLAECPICKTENQMRKFGDKILMGDD